MESIKWKNPGRKRHQDLEYTSPDFVKGYDLDQEDFTNINEKKKKNEPVTRDENDRYGIYIMTMIEIVLEGRKFKKKPFNEKCELRDQMSFELLQAIRGFDPTRGSKIFSYAYRCAYVAACHYYTEKQKEYDFTKRIYEIIDNCPTNGHKVNTNNYSAR